MRIMHVIVGLEPGGAELMLKRLVERCRLQTPVCEQVVLSLTDVGTVGVALQELGVQVTAMEVRSFLGLPAAVLKLAKHIRRFDPDIVQTWMYHADFLGGLAARLVGRSNVVWGIRCTDVRNGGSWATLILRRVSAWLSRVIPRAIICVADASMRAHASIGYDKSKMVVIPNGFDISKFVQIPGERLGLRALLGFDCDHIVVGTVGRFHADKDYENFVRAAACVAERVPGARFLMIGRELTEKNLTLRGWIEETGFADRFVLVGERPDVPRYLSAFDIFVLPSRNEGFPNVVGEAMSACVPCVVTDVGDAALLVGEQGVVVPKENPTALACGIMQLAQMSFTSRTELGLMLRRRIENEYTLDRACARFTQLYAKIIKRSVS